VSGVDLIVDATAELGVQHFVSDLARAKAIPYICTSTTPGAWGGIVGRILLGQGKGCWKCLQHSLNDGTIVPPPYQDDGTVQPHGCADPTFTGRGFDIGQVALSTARLAVETVLEHEIPWDIEVIAFRDRETGNMMVPSWKTYTLERHPDCDCSAE